MFHIRQLLLTLTMLLLPIIAVSSAAQSLVIGQVQDAFLKVPLPGVKVSLLLSSDSTVVVDSIHLQMIRREDGTIRKVQFNLQPEKRSCQYLLRAQLKGYEDAWMPLTINATDAGALFLDQALELRRMMRQQELGEAVVKATKVKMFYKGDTLVYNADAFQLPEGSMLDNLIRQMPGVTMNNDGEIFVNGRKIDELLLGSRSFMNGNKQVLLQNLPYFTVKNIKVYHKQTDMSVALGHDVEPRKFVMDVRLKKEYQVGYIANVEAAAGTHERWLGRGFLLRFDERWRYALMGNANNVNETNHIKGNGHWTPATMPQSMLTTRSTAANLNYHDEAKKLTNDFTVDFTSSTTQAEMRKRYEQFLVGHRPTAVTESRNRAEDWTLKLQNSFSILKPFFFDANTQLRYQKTNGHNASEFQQWDKELMATQRLTGLSEGRMWMLSEFVQGGYGKKGWHTGGFLSFRHTDELAWQANRYDTWQASTQGNGIRYNSGEISNRKTYIGLRNSWTFRQEKKLQVAVSGNVHYTNHRIHDFLYHPDTLLLPSQLDMLNGITDRNNSYDSHLRSWESSVGASLSRNATAGIFSYTLWEIGLDVPVYSCSLDYQRGTIDTLMHSTSIFLKPRAVFRYLSPDTKSSLEIRAEHTQQPADMMNQIAYRDDSHPLIRKEGNPALKGTARSQIYADYTRKFGANLWHARVDFNYHHRNVVQAVSYEPQTGVYTYKPMNVDGAYDLKGSFDISSALDVKRYWTWQMNADASYIHSVDHSLLANETSSRANAVNTLILHDGGYLQYDRSALNLRAKADIRWRRSEGRMRDFTTLNVVDFNYGLSARYTLPLLKTTLSADATIYMRRGYGSTLLNRSDFVMNASASQPFLKGKLTMRIEAFDLLHQLSTTQYEVNAQGRTEQWFRSLPHYLMLHAIYHFNKNPKRKK